MKEYYRCGYAPFVAFGPVFETKKECTERAREENKYGEYKGRGIKVYKVNKKEEI